MFEGLVRQLILGYLGQYIKDIQKEQLRITLWNEEVLLENVELILEAFDYLQLPFALKQGRVGRLSIKIPWKKLGWDPIIITIEHVLICACQRDDQEWSLDAVERREFAGKKAKLAAAELAKLSRRVCDNRDGESFISYITAKILDGIQVSIRNVHVLYHDMLTDSPRTIIGLKFSSLTVMKQNLSGFSTGKARVGQVNKLVEVQGLEIYCRTFQNAIDLMSIYDAANSEFWGVTRLDDHKYFYLLAPLDLSVTLLVNRSGKIENDAPQYSINVELNGLVMSLDEVQLQEILNLCDYLCTCQLREKYGRYRPWWSPLSEKLEGWQTAWWHYAQQAVLSDVRKRLRRTSWKYLGERLSCLRKYVNLYKKKLECLHQEQLLGEDILWELEQMEKESDIDDILSYRSAAERELQEFLVKSSSSLGINGADGAVNKLLDDERPASKPRGWLNWLSRGMLGAGGTDDSSQFSGVVSDEVIKDIYEATKFHPVLSRDGDAGTNDEIYLSSVKFNIDQISVTLRSMRFGREIAELRLQGIFMECKIWEDSAVFTATVNYTEMLNPFSKQVILLTRRAIVEDNLLEIKPSLNIQVDVLPVDREVKLSAKVMLQPLEVTCDSEFLLNIMEFYNVLGSVKFHHESVLLSLNGIDDVKARLLSKAEYILSSRKRVTWNANFQDVTIIIPWENANLETHKMVLEVGALSFMSKREISSFLSDTEYQAHVLKSLISFISAGDTFREFQLQDLYDHFDIKLSDIEMKILMPYSPGPVSVLEKFSASITLGSCVIPDESILKSLEVYINVSSLVGHFSPSLYGAILGLVTSCNMLNFTSDSTNLSRPNSLNSLPNEARASRTFSFSIIANLESASFLVDLESDVETCCMLMLSLQELDIRLVLREFPECWICSKTLKIITKSRKNEADSQILCSSKHESAALSAAQYDMGGGLGNRSEKSDRKSTSVRDCFLLHYEAGRKEDMICHKFAVCVSDVDLHCYPYIIGLLVGFFDRISGFGISHVVADDPTVDDRNPPSEPGFEFQSFGFSNFFETGSSECASIPLDRFPFVTVYNVGSPMGLESSLIYGIPEWRKKLNLRDQKIRSPEFSLKKGSNVPYASQLKSKFGTVALPAQRRFDDIKLFVIDLDLSNIKLHFHDSSCIVATVTLPTSTSSFSIHEDCLDILCSTGGLILSSSWCTQTIHDFLWGPSLPYLSPILNIRVRKPLRSPFELSFSIQHVTCILPPEFLAIIIGYFSLPDWSSSRKEQPVIENGHMDPEDDNAITYKFEILDSVLFTPVESGDCQYLKLDFQQLYCSFFQNSDSNIILKDIPSECLVPAHKVADRNHHLTVFGHDLYLSMLLRKDDAFDSLNFNQNILCRDISLIAPFSADVWVIIPREYVSLCVRSVASTCIMARVGNCQVIAEGGYILSGYKALHNIIDQFSLVHKEAKGFTSDVLQFLQLKKCMKETSSLLPESSSVTFTEVRCCVNSLSIKLHRSRRERITSELVAKAEMKFVCSASLRNDKPVSLDFSFCSLALFSFLSSVMLVECIPSCSLSSVLDVKVSVSDLGEIELHLSFPSLDIWLHLFDWSEVIKLFYTYSEQVSKTSTLNLSSMNSTLGLVDQLEHVTVDVSEDSQSPTVSSNFASDNMKPDAVFLAVKFDNIGIMIHYPVLVSGEAFSVPGEAQVHEESHPSDLSNVVDANPRVFVAITLQSRHSELVSDGKCLRLKLDLEKASGKVELFKKKCVHNWPFFQLFQVNVAAESDNSHMDHVLMKAEVQCDSLDVWLSYHILYFWQSIEIPEAGSSEFVFSGMGFNILLRKVSLLLTDGKCSSSGPLLEILMGNLLLCANISENIMESSVAGDLQVNYNNIHKVSWEPFIEPSKFETSVTRRHEKNALLSCVILTDIHVKLTQLNLNLTESLIEVVFRATEMIKDACGLRRLNVLSENSSFLNSPLGETVYTRRYAPYVVQNLTSLPFVFRVCEGPVKDDSLDVSAFKDGELLQPGSSVPIYIDEAPEEQLLCSRPANSSDRLSDKQFLGVAHRYIIVQLEGTSIPSPPISMDVVGLSYFEVDFSNSSNELEVDIIGDSLRSNDNIEGNNRRDTNNGFVIPVVIDVSIQRYTKLVRLYSMVVLVNATSMPFEVRFDIPFGVSPKILDPIYPGGEFPLPLHLAEAGRMRWRPLGNTYLWSEAYNILTILSHESRIGFLRSFVCYPSHPSSDPFRCCISVHNMCLPSIDTLKKGSSPKINDTIKQSVENCGQVSRDLDKSKNRSIHFVTLKSPLIVKNYLPEAVSVTIESGGVTRTELLSEVETSFFHVDSSHDLAIHFHMRGFRPSILKFPRAETFGAMAKFSGTKFSLCETITFDSDLSKGSLYVNMEKVMDALSGAREICIYVPFFLYNCTGYSLIVSNSINEMKGHGCIVPSCYDLDEQDLVSGRKVGLQLLSSTQDFDKIPSKVSLRNSSLKNHNVRKNVNSKASEFLGESLNLSGSSSQSNFKPLDSEEIGCKKVTACMYSPDPNCSASEIMVKVSRCLSEGDMGNIPNSFWSSPFFLVPPTGSTTVLVPHASRNAAYITSITSNPVGGPFSGRTRIITFQPRYVISNACSKGLCYKQKGTDVVSYLGVGQHSHIQWTDTSRELLVSIRFDEPGWQWSGCFLPEHLGDTQVKMRSYVSGAADMIRVEVQNADVSIKDENIAGSLHENSGTILILLSDDDTGFMPYRIDNFSKERLRVYQQRCEAFETTIHSYTSCPYAWDEPFYPHRLTVEVPGERVIGSYTLDDVKEHTVGYLPATSEKPERTLLISVHAEGTIKVLSIIDSSYHILNDVKGARVPRMKEKRERDRKPQNFIHYEERISIAIPFVGVSVMSSYPQELLFACAKNTAVDLVQSLDQQKLSLQISSLQIDNQLHDTPYPVILSFDHKYRSNLVSQVRNKDEGTKIKSESVMQIACDRSREPVVSLAAAKWRNKDIPLVSFEYITIRVADFHLELEQEVILNLFDLFKTVTLRFQSSVLPQTDSTLHPLFPDFGIIKESSTCSQTYESDMANRGQIHSSYVPKYHRRSPLAPLVVPIGAPWQKIYLLARKQKKIYVELFDLAPIKLTLSFASSPWMLRNGVPTSGESLIHRGLMALADVEGVQIHLKQLIITHQLASWESIQEILVRHYTRQLLHEMYKVFGSAGVIGNPMGFARRMGLGFKDFLSVPARSVLQSPAGLITGMAQGTTSLLSNTVYAISDAATQFSRVAHKGIVAFTFDDQAVAMEKQPKGMSSHSKGVIDEFLEGLTGLLQSPIKGAEKHGLPGVLSGIALGVTGLVARPAASILEVTGKTAQSIRNRSKLHHMGSQRFRVRLPRPLSRDFPLMPYSWEEAVGISVLAEDTDDGLKLKDEMLVMCKALKQGGKFVLITERLVLIVSCSSLVDLGKPEFRGIPAEPLWVIEAKIGMDSVIHADADGEVVHIVRSSVDTFLELNHHRQKGGGTSRKRWNNSPPSLPFYQTNLEFTCKEEAEEFLHILLSTIEKGKEQGWGCVYMLHQSNLK